MARAEFRLGPLDQRDQPQPPNERRALSTLIADRPADRFVLDPQVQPHVYDLSHRRTVTLAQVGVIGGDPETIPELGGGLAWDTLQVIGDRSAELLERSDQLDQIDACLRAVSSTSPPYGRLLIIDGPPGIGKTSLIDAARRRASAAGYRVLRARGGQLEQDFAFGVVRQLLEPLTMTAGEDERRRWLAGAAAPDCRDPGLPSRAHRDCRAAPGSRHAGAHAWCAQPGCGRPLAGRVARPNAR